MKTPKEILAQWSCIYENDDIDRDDAIEAMKEYALEILDEVDSRIADVPEISNTTLYDTIGKILEELKQQINGK